MEIIAEIDAPHEITPEDDFIYCTLCDYKSPKERKDNFDRHMNQNHFNTTTQCECGKQMKPSSLSRHKKSACILRKKNLRETSSNKFKVQCVCGKSLSLSSLSRHKNISCSLREKNCREPSVTATSDTNSSSDSSVLVCSSKHKFELQVDTFSDGRTIIMPGKIKIGNITIVLMQKQRDITDSGIISQSYEKWIDSAIDNIEGKIYITLIKTKRILSKETF